MKNKHWKTACNGQERGLKEQRVYRNIERKQREYSGMEAKKIKNFKKAIVMNNLKFCRAIKEGEERERNHSNHFLFTFESQL